MHQRRHHELEKSLDMSVCMSTTYFNTKIILDALDCKVLAQRAELVINVLVLNLLVVPLGLQHFQSLNQHRLGPHFARIRSLGQPEVRLFNSHTSALSQSAIKQVIKKLLRSKDTFFSITYLDTCMFRILFKSHLTFVKSHLSACPIAIICI